MDYEEFNALEPSKKTMDRIKDILTYQPMTLEEICKKLQIGIGVTLTCLIEMVATNVVEKKFKDNEIAYYGLTDWQPINRRILKEIIE